MEEGISVIICCFNSSLRLKPTLEHLYLQKNIDINQWEIILIDNGSTDKTAEKATEIWQSFPLPKPSFKVVFEEKPGLSFARIKGIAESKFKFVLFCDDDNWLEHYYLSNALTIMGSSKDIGALGGIGTPVFENKEPPYFWINQFHTLAVGAQSDKEGDITNGRGVLYGAGMVLNKVGFERLLKEFDFEFQASDRVGDSLSSSGDHELCLALRKIEYKIYYSKNLSFKHYIPEKRTTIKYYKSLFYSFGKSAAYLLVYFVDSSNQNSIKNDYRYICMRCGKIIIQSWLTLLFAGYYVGLNKYKYLHYLHYLYDNIGMFKVLLSRKNIHRSIFKEKSLFQFLRKDKC
jgi:glycosyltransferase involved in cell wall biosynthesis